MRYYIPLVCILCGISWKNQAQESDTITLTALYHRAMQYPDIKAREAVLRETESQYDLVRLANLPQIEVQAQNTFGSYQGTAGAFFPLPGIFNVSGTDPNTNATATNMVASGVIRWNAIQFGKHRERVKAARIQKAQTSTSLDMEKLRIKSEVSQAYIAWLYYHNMQQWALRETERFNQLMDVSRSLVSSGIAAAADSLMIKASLQQARALKESWESKIATANNMLFRFTGLQFRNIGQTTPVFFSTIKEPGLAGSIPDDHPVIRLKQQEKAFAEKQEEIAGKSILPDISLLAGGQLRGTAFSHIEGDQWKDSYKMPVQNYLVGVGVTWTLNEFYTTPLKVRKYREQTNRYKAEQESASLRLQESHRSAQQQIIHAARQIREAEQAYEAAKEAYRLYGVRYRSGIIDLTDLLQIQQALQFTDKERIAAYYQYWNSVVHFAESRADFSPLTQTFH